MVTPGPVTAKVKPLAGSVLIFPQTCRTEPTDYEPEQAETTQKNALTDAEKDYGVVLQSRYEDTAVYFINQTHYIHYIYYIYTIYTVYVSCIFILHT